MATKTQMTPLMQQYYEIKKEHQDAILFFRLGDFYEMFGEDARTAAPLLEVALTKRQDTPMCGLPHHAVNHYIAKLIKRGFRVAICEQITDDNADSKNLFTRKVVHTITPGMLIEENLLNARTNNFIASLFIKRNTEAQHALDIGLSVADISTGEFSTTEFTDTPRLAQLSSQLALYEPKEIIVPDSFKSFALLDELFREHRIAVHYMPAATYTREAIEHLPASRIIPDNHKNNVLALSSCIALLSYIEKTRPQAVDALKQVTFIPSAQYLSMDEHAVTNLELIEGLASRTQEGSLLEVLDYTRTPMGARTLRQWILHPLIRCDEIIKRQNAIRFFVENPPVRNDIQEKLKTICDLERTFNRLITGSANARDVNAIKNSLESFSAIYDIFRNTKENISDPASPLYPWCRYLTPLPEVVDMISSVLVDSPPLSIKEGGIILSGYNTQLDEFRNAVSHGKDWIAALEKKERERTGIHNLKIGYTSVFGYYIEVSKSHLNKIPDDYHRRQTLTNGERFITPELKKMEDTILGAETKAHRLEYRLFQELRTRVLDHTDRIHHTAGTIAALDTLFALAETAARNDYTCPEVHDGWGIEITEGRHPVVERTVRARGGFVPNDCIMDNEGSLWIITGPNMSGKSTFLRQTALLVLMAQMGSFVPARHARTGLIDKIFTRIGAADNLARGESTFMVEMKEMAYILSNLTRKSLLILDEVGRGTSTYDGVSIAWAVIEYLQKTYEKDAEHPKPLVLFATHYFELTELAESLTGIKNYNVDVKEWQNKIIFLHKIVPGCADRSYGVHVADLAGLPHEIITRAKKVLYVLESQSQKNIPLRTAEQGDTQMNLFESSHPIIEELNTVDINQITPMSALKLLADWKERFNSS